METLHYDTLIVGGGIAGLTSAAYLSRAGHKVLVCEKNNEVGGLVGSFVSDGFHFEAGVRALENAGIILPMLHNLGIHLEVVRSKVSIGIEDQILNIEDIHSIPEYRKLLVSLYPESEAETDRFFKSMRKIMNLLDVLYGIENPLFKDLKKDRKYVLKKLLPWLPKFLLAIHKINRLNVPFESFLEERITNPALRDIISQHFFKGTPAFFALSYFSLYLDYFYPKGGVGKITEELVKKIESFNGEIRTNTRITAIDAAKQCVTDASGQIFHYKNLIWAADLKTLYTITRADNLPTAIREKFEATGKSVLAGKGSESVFSLYLQADLPLSYFGAIAHGHFFYTPYRTGLGNIHRSELANLLMNWDNTDKPEVLAWLDRFLWNNTFEVSIPGLKDASLVPENKTGLIISFICEFEWWKKLQESGWYEEFRKAAEDTIIRIFSETVYPGLKEKVLKQFSFTPISISERIASSGGAIVGWSFTGSIPVVHKIQRSDRSVLTALPNIYQAGQWAYSPAGVPMSILTGKLAADRVEKNSRKRT